MPSCFYFELIGADIEATENEFQIVRVSDSAVMWNSLTDGSSANETLVLAAGDYEAQLIFSEVDAAVYTLTYYEYPVGP